MSILDDMASDLFEDIKTSVEDQQSIESLEDTMSKYDDDYNEQITNEDPRLTSFSVEEYNELFKPNEDEKTTSEEVATEIVLLSIALGSMLISAAAAGAVKLIIKHEDWIENFFGKIKNRVIVKKGKVTIKGINYTKLKKRIKEMYDEKNLNRIFSEKNTWLETLFYKRKVIKKKKDMKIVDMTFDEFFAMEVRTIFRELAIRFDMPYYDNIADKIVKKTWVNGLTKEVEKEDVSYILKDFYFTPKSYQREFVELYRGLKDRMKLEGYILSFDQGLGKTFTALMINTLLKKEILYIVCINTMKNVWVNEIKEATKLYKDNETIALKEIFVFGDKYHSHFDPKDTKIVIMNIESLNKISKFIVKNKDSMIVIDESQNFRFLDGSRVKYLLELKDKTGCKDVLPMSGTPIKARPNELVPTMYMIDPLFNMDVAKIYNYCFNVDQTYAATIINERFGYIIHRKTKADVDDELKLPARYESEVRLSIKNPEIYSVDSVKAEVIELFNIKYSEKLEDLKDLKQKYHSMVKHYSSGSNIETQKYLNYISRSVDPKKGYKEYHELTVKQFEEFAELKIIPNIKNTDELKLFKELTTKYVMMRKSAMGEAIGSILPKRRSEMYSTMILENSKYIMDMIQLAKKKVTFFSTMLPVVAAFCKVLSDNDVGYIKIVGGGDTKTRAENIVKFKLDDDIEALVGTSQTLGVGVTLTEASDMFVFGPPWRKTDFNQLGDRLHRIGQTDSVYIRNVLLQSKAKNLSDRMTEIMEWSGDMFNSYIEGN